ncbi:phage head-binding domain-containing protein [Yersinia pekkanenii]|uniref:Head binding n=1 Tax=Yersinia pekkanenii TaxID=1288385 RepID=A0A0T9QGW8_9GAMM|nr:phage head-binding domain-containing protein [Yersinia pekkanenii]CNI09398.1 Head binding [Yersinia pekkanenii]CRY68009.1 Head binding [Yersinia pekkanenii]
MPDIIPNVVIGMPSQLFTMPRKFGAVFGGRIYIGLIDTDPTIPSNQIQVYLENEDGSLVPMAQPILINAGGFPVYNGQIAKFVTVQGHSMAVYDALNVQQFYFPNVLKYDPDQFRQYLDSQGGAVTVNMLGEPTGASLVGVQPQGNLSQAINWVTPEQFGAIGDGTVHPLSERYATLAAAQAVYPHVTSLSQTIDWAACQGAENYARGVSIVKCPTYAKYHFGSTDYLELAIDSKWYGTKLTQTDRPCTTMIRTDPVVPPAFGQDCIVRVKNSAAAGSADEFVRGIVFEGFKLTRNLARRPNVRGKNSIGLHLNFGMKAIIDVTINGCDFGVLGYGCWGSTGVVRIDSCHKGIYLDGWNSTPENAGRGTLTSIDWRVEIDVSVFPIYLAQTTYSKFTGFYEGLRDTFTDFYKKDIETACGVTLDSECSNVDFFLGIEAFQGTHLTCGSGNNITLNNFYFNDYAYNGTTGINGAKAQIDGLMGRSTPQISSASRAFIFAHGLNNNITVINPTYFGGNITDDPEYVRYFYNIATGNAISTIGGYVSLASLFSLTRARFNLFRPLNTRNILSDYFPSGYTPTGADVATHKAWQTKVTGGGDGRVALDAPSGYRILDFTALVIGSTTSSPMVLGVLSSTDSQIQLQSNAGGVTVQYKLTIQITK